VTTAIIDPRFNGFTDIALGGYVGGLLARGRNRAEVTLRRPVRLGTPYEVNDGPDGTSSLSDQQGVLALAQDTRFDLDAAHPIGLAESQVASESYLGFTKHLIPKCFVCGPGRAEGDGLRIFPGPVAGRDAVAAPWTPFSSLADQDGYVRPEFIWSALDCPTIWAILHQSRPDDKARAVTAKLAVERFGQVRAGRPHVVVGWKVGETDRSRVAGGAVYSEHGELLALARHTMALTDWGAPLGLNAWR